MKKTLFIFTLTLPFISFSQTLVKGKITSKKEPIVANIIVKNSAIGTITSIDGNYSISIPTEYSTMSISAVGYKTQEITVEHTLKSQTINIDLKEDILGLDKVVITATRGYLNRKKAPVIVSVTDTKTLEAVQSINLSDGLKYQPGLRMETNCQNCGTAEVKMNGLGGAYSQILIDNRPIFSALNSVYGLEQIPANIIKQIEVVRGGGSALYGSNAVAGTINIITKDPTENKMNLASNIASINGKSLDKTLSFNGTITTENFRSGMAVFGMRRQREAYDHDGDGYTELPFLENTSFGLKAFNRPGERKKITAEFNANTEHRRGGNKLEMLPFLADVTEEINSDVISGGVTYDYQSKNLADKYAVYATTSVSKNNNFYGGLTGEPATDENIIQSIEGHGSSKDITIVAGAQYNHNTQNFFGKRGTFTGGLEHRYNDIVDKKENPAYEPIEQITNLFGVYGQQEISVSNKLKLLGGLRADMHNLTQEKIVFNPRANILYKINNNLRWRTSYAKGFRAPQIYGEDIHAGLAGGEISRVRNAENLKSETSHSFVTSLDWTKEKEYSDFNLVSELFYTELLDAFALEQGTETAPDSGIFEWIRVNSTGAKVYGLNLELKYAPSEKWLIQANGTLQRSFYNEKIEWSEDEPDQATKEFNKTPKIYGNCIITYAPSKVFQNNLAIVYTGPMYVQHLAGYIPKDKLEKTPHFLELNWKTAHSFYLDKHQHSFVEISGGVQNILNSYQSDFDQGPGRNVTYIYGPQRPRSFFIGLKFAN